MTDRNAHLFEPFRSIVNSMMDVMSGNILPMGGKHDEDLVLCPRCLEYVDPNASEGCRDFDCPMTEEEE